MKRSVLAMTFAMVGIVGLINAGAQTPAPPQKKAAPTAAKDSKADKLLKDLPPAVKATVEAETKNATLKELSKEKEKGKTVYELRRPGQDQGGQEARDGAQRRWDAAQEVTPAP